MGALQGVHELVVAAEHVGRGGQQLEVQGPERLRVVGAGEGLMGLSPRPSRVGVVASLEFEDCVHLPRGRPYSVSVGASVRVVRTAA
jgi:hypothetical protein